MQESVISRNPEIMGGTPVFRGTRVPVQTLLDYLAVGETVDDFRAGFPSVARQQVLDFLDETKDAWSPLPRETAPRRVHRLAAWPYDCRSRCGTAKQMGWTGIKNGELLALASGAFRRIH
jgi:uncharacterized protein (DUF433 family)